MCLNNSSCLWILIILLMLGCGTNLLNSRALSGCGWPFLLACAYCLGKNGTLSRLVGGNNGCGCNG